MSQSAIRNRKALPTRRELRDRINWQEIRRDMRAVSWGEYLIETGRIYQ
ncbi:hypothetical protein [Mycobacterium sp. CnD-18-1]|nr:hypothetical protein [Mycobacterium sp. CnD-18-1]MCG7607115.1 hypothetical protein [Mycobacterium sp. CnD-18-1]